MRFIVVFLFPFILSACGGGESDNKAGSGGSNSNSYKQPNRSSLKLSDSEVANLQSTNFISSNVSGYSVPKSFK